MSGGAIAAITIGAVAVVGVGGYIAVTHFSGPTKNTKVAVAPKKAGGGFDLGGLLSTVGNIGSSLGGLFGNGGDGGTGLFG